MRVEACRLEAAIVETERLALPELHEEFAVIRVLQRLADKRGDALALKTGAGEEKIVGR